MTADSVFEMLVNVETRKRFPHSHSRDGGCEQVLQLNSNPSALTHMD